MTINSAEAAKPATSKVWSSILNAISAGWEDSSRPRHPRLYRDELTPHLARDLGLMDAMEKPSLSQEVLERSPRL